MIIKRILKQTLVVVIAFFSICSTKAYDFEVEGIYYNITSTADLTCEVTRGYEKYSGDIVIPEKVKYESKTLDVTAVGQSAFYECYSLQSIEIPNSVTFIGEEAFYYCTSLQSIEIPNSVTTIDDYAFYK